MGEPLSPFLLENSIVKGSRFLWRAYYPSYGVLISRAGAIISLALDLNTHRDEMMVRISSSFHYYIEGC